MDKLRKEFEEKLSHDYGDDALLKNSDGDYIDWLTADLWDYWQASRASIVVELPDTDNYWNGTSGHEIFNHRQFAADSCDALRDIGLSIKGE